MKLPFLKQGEKKLSTTIIGTVITLLIVTILTIGIPSYYVIVQESNKVLTEQQVANMQSIKTTVEELSSISHNLEDIIKKFKTE